MFQIAEKRLAWEHKMLKSFITMTLMCATRELEIIPR